MKKSILSLSLLLCSCAAIKTKIEIKAPTEIVEKVFFDLKEYPAWNPFITDIQGDFAAGSTLKIIVKPLGKPQMAFNPTVLVSTRRTVSWRGRFLMPGIFTGEHEFIIESMDSNTTVFYQNERFSGILIPFFGLGPTRAGFESMNSGLKQRAESEAGRIGKR
jgi:hypothetical protein